MGITVQFAWIAPELNSGAAPYTLSSATPRVIGRRGPVAKRRFQKGCFQIKNGMAYAFYYEDAERTDGTLYTRKVRHFVGRVGVDGMSNRAARREHDCIMQDVNNKRGSVAPTIHGKTFLDAVNAWRKAIAPALSPATVRAMESHLKIHIPAKIQGIGPTRSRRSHTPTVRYRFDRKGTIPKIYSEHSPNHLRYSQPCPDVQGVGLQSWRT
jgi:hypothetical protein